ncbi:S-adenosyl-L-methionine-dependent methyltransferase [Trametopsis cervina]|nr:S-adenosyl-L-methionine-dependent methyltransferase [Trametopsis cervina]
MMNSLMDALLHTGYAMLDKGLIPDIILRPAIRTLCRQRIREIEQGGLEANHEAKMKWIERVQARASIADVTHKANEQHYEVSTAFILSCTGTYAKYSCCLYPTGKESLDEAEILMLDSYCTKARLRDGMDILDLGCGWGSLSLFMARKYPGSRITALSNSSTQKQYIDTTARAQGLTNVKVITGDVNTYDFESSTKFDRIMSIEMFEHMKNYKMLMAKIASWLRPKAESSAEEALCFIQIFCHRSIPYHFEDGDGWMSDTFFSGGTMPSHDLLLYFQDDLTLLTSWYVNGRHYARTSEDWLKKQDQKSAKGLAELEQDAERQGLGREHGRKMFYRFRVFFLTCAEFFAMNGGEEWGVGHYLFKRKD